MNKHTKLAVIIAPFLALIGYIASDYYMEYSAKSDKIFTLQVDGSCNILAEKCILKSGELKFNILDKNGLTTVNSTYPLDSATLLVVISENNIVPYTLAVADNPYYWNAKTIIRESLGANAGKLKLRLIATVKGGKYISEFYTESN